MSAILDIGWQVAFWAVGALSTWFLGAYLRVANYRSPYAQNIIGTTLVIWILWAMSAAATVWPAYPGRPVIRLVLGWLAVFILAQRIWLFHRDRHRAVLARDDRPGGRRHTDPPAR